MNYTGTRLSEEVMGHARAEAFRLRHNVIEPAHLVLGLLGVREGVASSVLDSMAIDREEIRGLLEDLLPAGEATPAANELPFSEAGAAILRDWMAEADKERVPYLTTGQLLLAVFENHAWPRDEGLGPEDLRRRVVQTAAASAEHEDLA